MNRNVAVLLMAGALLFGARAAFAHHSVAGNFDQSKTVDITGKVKKIALKNPHSQITLEVKKPDGSVSEFFVEWSDVNSLKRRSVEVSKIHAGDQVTINVNPSRRLQPRILQNRAFARWNRPERLRLWRISRERREGHEDHLLKILCVYCNSLV